MWPLMTFEVIFYFTKSLHYIVSIYKTFYQNLFINECARKKKVKIPESRSHGIFKWYIQEFMFLIIVIKNTIWSTEPIFYLAVACQRRFWVNYGQERLKKERKKIHSLITIFAQCENKIIRKSQINFSANILSILKMP